MHTCQDSVGDVPLNSELGIDKRGWESVHAHRRIRENERSELKLSYDLALLLIEHRVGLEEVVLHKLYHTEATLLLVKGSVRGMRRQEEGREKEREEMNKRDGWVS